MADIRVSPTVLIRAVKYADGLAGPDSATARFRLHELLSRLTQQELADVRSVMAAVVDVCDALSGDDHG